MKNALILLSLIIGIIVLYLIQTTDQNNTIKDINGNLFKVVENDKFGFINVEGELIIPIKYHSAGNFSEGLCPVRLNGTFGYINSSDKFIIPAHFDYARSFEKGLALAYIDGKSFFIDTLGQKVFDADFKHVENFKNGWAKVWTVTDKQGLLNKQGELVIDTIFKSIREFKNGLTVVEGLNHHPYKDNLENYEVGVIDTLGNFVIPYGQFSGISNFNDGLALAYTFPDDKGKQEDVYIDTNGKIIIELKKYEGQPYSRSFQDGLTSLSIYKNPAAPKDELYYSDRDDYCVIINTKGETIINDTTYNYFSKFQEGRAFGVDKNYNRHLLDKKGNKITEKVFRDANEKGFHNGLAIVEKSRDAWGIIDTNGHFVIPPNYTAIHEVGIIDQYFFFGVYDKNRSGHHQNKKYGIATLEGDTILQPMMHYFSDKGFQNGLLICEIDEKFAYINKNGEIVWQEQEVEITEISNQDIDFMNEGYFHPKVSNPLTDHQKNQFPKNTIVVRVSKEQTILKEKYKAQKVILVNTMDSAILFNAQDGRVNITVQALDKHGKWRDIEYLRDSWCGNSYHDLALEANQYWEFAAAIYTGDFKTKLRVKVAYVHPEDNDKKYHWKRRENIIYSNEYSASINPSQFWRKTNYNSRSLMNPYND